jgi:hypothetical protein
MATQHSVCRRLRQRWNDEEAELAGGSKDAGIADDVEERRRDGGSEAAKERERIEIDG